MEDHQEMIRAAAAPAAMYNAAATSSGVQASHGGDWWKWNTAASEQSPGSNSLATSSSITFQEPTGAGTDPACNLGAVPETVAAGLATGWNQPFLDESGFHGYMTTRSDHHAQICNQPSLMSPSSSNNSMMLQQQDHHDQNYHQFLSSLGLELLSSPASSPYGGGSRPASSLLRSLTEPSPAAGKPDPPGFQQYQPASTMNQAASARESLQFTNNTTYWNTPSTGLFTAAPPPAQPRPPATLAAKNALEGVGDSGSIVVKKTNTDSKPQPKKARTGTSPSPLPTFKFQVRKEKLGDRITALQQLVSPFGKTDTASVLHETIEYIKFLHEQVGAHSAPYLKNRQQVPHLKSSTDKSKDDGEKRDLTGRGLCLVPISSTFAVASETPVVDFWNPFGAAFR